MHVLLRGEGCCNPTAPSLSGMQTNIVIPNVSVLQHPFFTLPFFHFHFKNQHEPLYSHVISLLALPTIADPSVTPF